METENAQPLVHFSKYLQLPRLAGAHYGNKELHPAFPHGWAGSWGREAEPKPGPLGTPQASELPGYMSSPLMAPGSIANRLPKGLSFFSQQSL